MGNVIHPKEQSNPFLPLLFSLVSIFKGPFERPDINIFPEDSPYHIAMFKLGGLVDKLEYF